MNSKTHKNAFAFFIFNQFKNTKDATRAISELYTERDAMTDRTCEPWFAKLIKGHRSLKDLPRTGCPQILDRQSH